MPQVIGQLDNGFQQIIFNDVAADIALSAAGITGEKAGPIVNRGNA